METIAVKINSYAKAFFLIGFFSAVNVYAAPPKPTVSVSFSPSSVTTGQNSTLNWSSTDATSCSGAPTTATSGSKVYPITTTSDWSYTITCTGPGGTSSSTAVLRVTPPPKPTVTASFSPSVVKTGDQTTLTWSSSNATSCDDVSATSGSKVYPVLTTSDWSVTITCRGPGGASSSTTVLKVTPPSKPTVSVSFSPNAVTTGQNSTLNWSSTDATSCSGAPTSAPSGSKVYPITTTSDWSYTITCTGPGGTSSSTAVLRVTPPPKPTVSVSFSPSAVTTGQNSTLNWSSTDATSCSGAPTSAPSGSKVYPITTTSDWSYTITCTGPGGTSSSTAVLRVTPPPKPTVTASFNPSSVKTGDQTKLTWSSTNATSCDEVSATSGSKDYPVLTTSDWSVTITCTGPGGTSSSTAVLRVTPPPKPTVSVSFSPSAVTTGQNSTLNWSSTDATSCSGAPTSAPSGSKVYPITTTSDWSYTITCTGPGGTSSSTAVLRVTPPPKPTVIASFNPSSVKTGDQTTLVWSSTDATSCDEVSASSGSKNYPVLTTSDWSVTITCTGPGGTSSATAVLKVTPPPKPTVTASFNPSSVKTGDQTTLVWSSTDATSCEEVSTTNGSKDYPVLTTSDWSYTITCTGPGGTSSATAVLKVTSPPKPTVTASFNPSSVKIGEQATLTWSSTDATSCEDVTAISGTKDYSALTADDLIVTITCSGAGGASSASATLIVTDPLPPKITGAGQNTTMYPWGIWVVGENLTPSMNIQYDVRTQAGVSKRNDAPISYKDSSEITFQIDQSILQVDQCATDECAFTVYATEGSAVISQYSFSFKNRNPVGALNIQDQCHIDPSKGACTTYIKATQKINAKKISCIWALNPIQLAGCHEIRDWTHTWSFTTLEPRQFEFRAYDSYPAATEAARLAGLLIDTETITALPTVPRGSLNSTYCYLYESQEACAVKITVNSSYTPFSCLWLTQPIKLIECSSSSQWEVDLLTTVNQQRIELSAHNSIPEDSLQGRLSANRELSYRDVQAKRTWPSTATGTIEGNLSCELEGLNNSCTISSLNIKHAGTPIACLWELSPTRLIKCDDSVLSTNKSQQKAAWEASIEKITATEKSIELRSHLSLPNDDDAARLLGKLLDAEKVVALNGSALVWKEFSDALKNNDRAKLRQLLDPKVRNQYEEIFDFLGGQIADVGNQIGDGVELTYASENTAEYLITKQGDNGQSYVHIIRLTKDSSGSWKVNSL